MTTRSRSTFHLICALGILSGLFLPGAPANPTAVNAQPGIMKWETITTPNSEPGKNDVLNPYIGGNPTGSEIRDLSVGSNGTTLIAAVTVDARYINPASPQAPLGILLATGNGGISWTTTAYQHLIESNGWTAGNHVYNVLIASDDPKLWAVTAGSTGNGPAEFWVTTDAGAAWSNTSAPVMAAGEAISVIDISVDYGSGRDLALATRSGNGAGRIFMTNTGGFSNWKQQTVATTSAADIFALKFSPTYNGDQSFAVVLATVGGTFYNIGIRDVEGNSTLTWVYAGNGVEIKASSAVASLTYSTLGLADLSLPSDFSGQSSSLRRSFVSLYSPSASPLIAYQTGIYRIDDSVVSPLSATPYGKQVYSIAFFGTYSQGKLVAGMVNGSPCSAFVPTMYMDTPCTCAGSCSMVSLKPPTGSANQGNCGSDNISLCSDNLTGIGAAIVNWNPDGSLAYASTGSGIIASGGTWWNSGMLWDPADPASAHPWISTLIPNDESAFSISRNNGDTWNQLSLIDTTIDWFNDVAVSADCTTLYIASVHRNIGTGCNEFDSVWRSTVSPVVASPLPAISPAGTYWERVFTHATAPCCRLPQTDLPLLRTANSCSESSDGGVVAWASQYSPAQAWSPDYGDYWVVIPNVNRIQDFTFDSSKTIYNLSPGGGVQRIVYTGTAWSNTLPVSLSGISGHTIVANNGKVLVGASFSDSQLAPVAYSADSAKNWYLYREKMPVGGNVHVTFDVDFDNNFLIYAAVDDNQTGTVYRNTAPAFTRWDDNDMMDTISSGATGPDWWEDGYNQQNGDPPHRRPYYGIVMAWTGSPQPALYAAHDNITGSIAPAPGGLPSNSGVCRTLESRNGIPKPGIYWDCLDIFTPSVQNDVHFTLEPSSLKACGCCSPNTNTTLFAIDDESGKSIDLDAIIAAKNTADVMAAISLNGRYMQTPGYYPAINQGMLWAYMDCLAKKGPVLRKPVDQTLVGADPVTGRNQQVDLAWEQLCLSTDYELQIAKDINFTLRINPEISNAGRIDAVTGSIRINTDKANVTSPAAWLSPGSLPEAGAIYYWRTRSYKSATGQIAISPWSETLSFIVKQGFIVNTPYLGVQLLAPDNGCISCEVKPAAFSWSPWKEAMDYEFQLSKDSEFKQLVTEAHTSTTGFEYPGTLDYASTYFWRVRATEINDQAIPSDWSATFSLTTKPAPAPEQAPVKAPSTPVWVWAVIGVGGILVIVTMILIMRSRGQI